MDIVANVSFKTMIKSYFIMKLSDSRLVRGSKCILALIERTIILTEIILMFAVPPGVQGVSRRFFLRDIQYYTVPAARLGEDPSTKPQPTCCCGDCQVSSN